MSDNDFSARSFRDVFTYLSSKKCNIPDDAILHIFVDVLQANVRDRTSIDESGVYNFLHGISNSAECYNDDIINLGLDIISWLGSNEDYFTCYQPCLTGYIRNVSTKIGPLNISVASALFNCLTCLTRHGAGLDWLIKENGDIHTGLLETLKNGSSLFLQKAVINYITSLCLADGNEEHQSTVDSLIKMDVLPVVKKFSVNLGGLKKRHPGPFVLSILKLLEGLCESKLVLEIMKSSSSVDDLTSIILEADKVYAEAALNVIRVLYSKEKNRIEISIDFLTKELLLKGDILQAQSVSLIRFKQGSDQDFQGRQLFLLPLLYVLDLQEEIDGKEMATSCSSLHRQMSNKQKLTTVLCKTIGNLELIGQDVFSLTTKLLQETLSEGQNCHTDLSQFLKENTKLQRCCLEHLSKTDKKYLNRKLSIDIGSCVIKIMSQVSLESQLYSACVKCLLPILPALLDDTKGTKTLPDPTSGSNIHEKTNESTCGSSVIPDQLALILQQNLCSVSWEQRDTTLEFLTDLIMQFKENGQVLSWVEENKLHHHAWQCQEDGESYVRATSIRCVYCASTCPRLWDSLLTLVCLSEEEVIRKIGSILETDTEAFTRRSAACFLHKFYMDREEVIRKIGNILETDTEAFTRRSAACFLHKFYMDRVNKVNNMNNSLLEYIFTTMCARIQDFDWEVKLCVVDFLNSIFDQELSLSVEMPVVPEYAIALQPSDDSRTTYTGLKHELCLGLKKCYDYNCLQSALTALNDYDTKVVQEAVKLVSRLKHRLKSQCENMGINEQELLECLLEINEDKSSDKKENENNNSNVYSENADMDNHSDMIADNVSECVKAILNFDESRHVQMNDDNDYINNPQSIIEDILSYGQKNHEDNIVDCY